MANFMECGSPAGTIAVNLDMVHYIMRSGEGCLIFFQGDANGTFVQERMETLMDHWVQTRA